MILDTLASVLNELSEHMVDYSPEDQLRVIGALSDYAVLVHQLQSLAHVLDHIDPEIVVGAFEAAKKCSQHEQETTKAALH